MEELDFGFFFLRDLVDAGAYGVPSRGLFLPLLGDLGGRAPSGRLSFPALGLFLPAFALGDLLLLGDLPAGAGGGTPGKPSEIVGGTPGKPSEAAARNGGGLGALLGFPAETAFRN